MKQIFMMLLMACANVAIAAGMVVVKSVEAHQRYPWNGLVDIVVTVQGSADDIAEAAWSFKAANCETGAALPVASIVPKGDDTGSGTTWARRFVWNAAKDVGVVKIDDLMLTVDAKILGGVQLWENGPYWAEYNVGASEPEEYGYYFWWGDTIGYKRNASNNGWISVNDGTAFSFSEDNCPTHGKNVSHLQSAGYIDSTGNLVAAHDAATAHLGAPWRTPTDAELSELINNCDTQWTTRGGVTGRLVSGRGVYASKSIFLPAAGYGNDSSRGSGGDYKSSTLHSDFTDRAWGLYFGSGYFGRYDYYRHFGESVRPLRGCANNSGFALAGNGVMTHLKLDCRTGVRECLSDGEILRYDADWYENGERVRITDNGTVVTEGSAGCYIWLPALIGSRVHELKLEVLSDDEVVAFETARFEADFVQPAKYTVVFRPNGGTGEMADQVFSFDEGQELTKCNFIREGCAFLGWSSIEGASDVEWADGAVVCNLTAAADGIVEMWAVWKVPLSVKSVKAQQRYPWNGLVDIVVTMEGFAGDVANSSCTFAATNCTTRAPVLVRNISQKGSDVGSGTTWTRRYVWDAVSDVGKEVIDDLLLVVGVEMGVQLWEDGPYWAQCNVGATRPEEYGWYFWWGGTVGYTVDEDYGWNSIDGKTTSVSFEACNCETYGKNISELLSAGYIDATGNLVAAHDAATVCLGTPWRMPKDSEIAALIGKCTVTGATRNEKAGLIVAGKGTYASRSIFLPASGLAYGPYLYSPYTDAYFWTSTLNSDESFYAKYLTFSPGYFSQGDRILRY